MTHNEAIEQLSELEEVVGYSDEFVLPTLTALTMAEEALEKQIPKKPLYHKKESREEYTYSKREFYKCPSCNETLFIQNHEEETYRGCKGINRYPQGERTMHCRFCGQAIGWNDEEDS